MGVTPRPDWEERRTSLRSILSFHDAPFTCSRSFHGCSSGRGRGVCRLVVGAWCGLWLRWLLFLFAAAEEAAEASFDLG